MSLLFISAFPTRSISRDVPPPATVEITFPYDDMFRLPGGNLVTGEDVVAPVVTVWPSSKEVDLILVFDSGFQEGLKDPLDYRAQAAVDLLSVLDPAIRVGLVDFAADARLVHGLSANHESVAAALLSLGTRGGEDDISNAHLGLEAALLEMTENGRSGAAHVFLLYLADPMGLSAQADIWQTTVGKLLENGVVVSGVYLGPRDNTASLLSYLISLTWGRAVLPVSVVQVDFPEDLDSFRSDQENAFTEVLPSVYSVALYLKDYEGLPGWPELYNWVVVDVPWAPSPPFGPVVAGLGSVPLECRGDKPAVLTAEATPWFGSPGRATVEIGRHGMCRVDVKQLVPVKSEINIVQGLVDYPLEHTRLDGTTQVVDPYPLIAGKDTLVRVNLGYGSLADFRNIDEAHLKVVKNGAVNAEIDGYKSESGWRNWGDTSFEQIAGEVVEFIVDGSSLIEPGDYILEVTLLQRGIEVLKIQRQEDFLSSSPKKVLFMFVQENLFEFHEETARQTLDTILDYFIKFPYKSFIGSPSPENTVWDFIPTPIPVGDDCVEYPIECISKLPCSTIYKMFDAKNSYNSNPSNYPAGWAPVGLLRPKWLCIYGFADSSYVLSNYYRGVLSHEFGHFFGNVADESPACCDPGRYGGHSINERTCGKYPCEDWGWNNSSNMIYISPYSFMEPGQSVSKDSFFERYEYRRTFSRSFESRSGELQLHSLDRLFIAYGFIGREDDIRVSNSFYSLYELSATPFVESDYYIVFKDDANIISSWPIQVENGYDVHTGELSEIASFYVRSPLPDGTSVIEIQKDGIVLWSINRSENSPTVKVLSPNGGEDFGPGETISIEWYSEDRDGDSLVYDVYYSGDGGTTYKLVSAAIKPSRIEINAANMPGSGNALIKVVASDGYNRGEDTSDNAFSVYDKKPVVAIKSPSSGELVGYEKEIRATAVAFDLEDGFLQNGFNWSIDGAQVMTSGGRTVLPLPEPGIHTLSVDVADKAGNVGSHSISILVRGDMSPVADAGAGYLLECQSQEGAFLRLDGSASRDPLGRPIHYYWDASAVQLDDQSSLSPGGIFPLGVTRVSLVISNEGEESKASYTAVAVYDSVPPQVETPPDVAEECESPNGTYVPLGTASASDLCSEIIGIWSEGPALFPLGTTSVYWHAKDKWGNISTVSQRVTVVDTTPPVLIVPGSIVAECDSHFGTLVDLGEASASDLCSAEVSISNDAPTAFPPGRTDVTWTVEDGRGNTSTGKQEVLIIDTLPPLLSVKLEPHFLWPPNHKMVKVHASIEVADICDPLPNVVLLSIESNEPDNVTGCGDGDTEGDIDGAEFGTDDRDFMLRAERCGNGTGRVYTVKYASVDSWGNVTLAADKVVVPHDMRLGVVP